MTNKGETATVPVLTDIYEEIHQERQRQDRKWGEQNHPMVPKAGWGAWGYTPDHQRFAKDLECPTANRARYLCEANAKRGSLTYFHILFEEVCEALEAASKYGESSPEFWQELIQSAAVIVAMLECVERKWANGDGGDGEEQPLG